MKNLPLLLIVFFTAQVYGGKFSNLKIFDNPVHYELNVNNDLSSPSWLKNIHALYALSAHNNYKSWATNFSKKYIELNGLNEKIFKEIKAEPSLHQPLRGLTKTTFIYQFEYRDDSEEFLVVVESKGVHHTPEEISIGTIKNSVAAHLFIKESNSWRLHEDKAIQEIIFQRVSNRIIDIQKLEW